MIRTLKAKEIDAVSGGFTVNIGTIVMCDKASPPCCYYPQPDGSVTKVCGDPIEIPFP